MGIATEGEASSLKTHVYLKFDCFPRLVVSLCEILLLVEVDGSVEFLALLVVHLALVLRTLILLR